MQARLTGLGEQAARSVKRDINRIPLLSFHGVPDAELPDLVRESEAEWARRRSWQVCLPCLHDPRRYSDLYEQPRRAS